MSFNNYQSTSNTGSGGGGGFTTGSNDGFQDFPKLAQIVANNVQKISNNGNRILFFSLLF